MGYGIMFRIRLLVQTRLSTRQGFGTHPHYEAPGDLPIKASKTQLLTSVSEAAPSTIAQSWPWGSQIADRKSASAKVALIWIILDCYYVVDLIFVSI